MVLETIYKTLGFIIFWSLLIISIAVIVGIAVAMLYTKWRDFWEAKSDKQWSGYKDRNEIPPKENLKKSWMYLQLAHPYKYGLKGDSIRNHIKSWENRREEKNNTE